MLNAYKRRRSNAQRWSDNLKKWSANQVERDYADNRPGGTNPVFLSDPAEPSAPPREHEEDMPATKFNGSLNSA